VKATLAAVMLLALCARAPEKKAAAAAPVALTPAEEHYRAAKDILDREDGSPDEAQGLLGKTLELEPGFALAYVELARCEERRAHLGGKSYSAEGLGKAMKNVEKAFELLPELLDAHIERANICRHQGDLQCTRDEATRIEALVPESFEASLVEAWLAEADGRARDAITHCQRALDRTDDRRQRTWAAELLAHQADKAPDAAVAERAYKLWLELAPKSAPAHGDYCRFLAGQQKWQDTVDACTAALDLKDSDDARESLGQACLEIGSKLLGQVDPRTVAAFECANKYLPEKPAAELGLAKALVEQALKDRAPETLDRAASLVEAAAGHGAPDAQAKQARDIVAKARTRLSKK
jgi:tetratricopeptide (TPR) repeat protein